MEEEREDEVLLQKEKTEHTPMLSYSKLELYNNCHFKYKLKYIDKHFINVDSLAADFGTLVHYVEETIANDIKANNNEPYFMIDDTKYIDLFNNADIHTDADNVIGYNKLKEKYEKGKFMEQDKYGFSYYKKANIYLETGIKRLQEYLENNRNIIVLETEKEFNWNYRGYTFHGFIDRILKDTNTNEIIIEDIKTWSAMDEKRHNLKTPLQFVIYCLAAKEIYGQDVTTCYYDLPIDGNRYKAGTKGFLTRGMKELDKLLDLIEAKDFTPNACPLCHWCEFSETFPDQPEEAKNLCPYFSHYTKKDNHNFEHENEWQGLEEHETVMKEWLAHKQRAADAIMNNPLYKDVLFPNVEIKVDTTRRLLKRRG